MVPLVFVAVFVIAGALVPGYSVIRHGVSQLGAGRLGSLFGLAFVVSGALIVALASGLRLTDDERGPNWRARLVAIAGVAMVIAGVVPTDPANG